MNRIQQKARVAVMAHLEATEEKGKAFARRCGVSLATLYRFLDGDDVSMRTVEAMLRVLGYRLDVVKESDASLSA